MKNKKQLWIILTTLWTIIIFAFSLQPGSTSSNLSGSVLTKILAWFAPDILSDAEKLYLWHSILRKCAHFAEYFVLGTFSINMFREMGMKRKAWLAAMFCLLIAGLDETLQLFVPGRSGRILDVLIDSSGAVCAICICFGLKRKR